MPFFVHATVFWFQISVNYLFVVQVLQSKQNLDCIELNPPPIEFIFLTKFKVFLVINDPVEVLARLVVENEANGISVYECFVESNDKGAVLRFEQHSLFVLRVFNSFVSVQTILANVLQSAELVLVDYQLNWAPLASRDGHVRSLVLDLLLLVVLVFLVLFSFGALWAERGVLRP